MWSQNVVILGAVLLHHYCHYPYRNKDPTSRHSYRTVANYGDNGNTADSIHIAYMRLKLDLNIGNGYRVAPYI